MKETEQRTSWYILSDNGKLAGIVQAGSHKLNNTGMIELAQNGHLPAKHIYIWFGAVGVGSVTEKAATGNPHQQMDANKGLAIHMLLKGCNSTCMLRVFICILTVLWLLFYFCIVPCTLSQKNLNWIKKNKHILSWARYTKADWGFLKLPEPIISWNSISESWRWKCEGNSALRRRTSAFSASRNKHFIFLK